MSASAPNQSRNGLPAAGAPAPAAPPAHTLAAGGLPTPGRTAVTALPAPAVGAAPPAGATLSHHGFLAGDITDSQRFSKAAGRGRSNSVRATPTQALQQLATTPGANPADVATATQELKVRDEIFGAAQSQFAHNSAQSPPENAALNPPSRADVEVLRNAQSAFEWDWNEHTSAGGSKPPFKDRVQVGVATAAPPHGAPVGTPAPPGVGISGMSKADSRLIDGGKTSAPAPELKRLAATKGGLNPGAAPIGTNYYCAGREAVHNAVNNQGGTSIQPSPAHAPEGLANTLIEASTVASNPDVSHLNLTNFTVFSDQASTAAPALSSAGLMADPGPGAMQSIERNFTGPAMAQVGRPGVAGGLSSLGPPVAGTGAAPTKAFVDEPTPTGRTRPRSQSVAAIRSSCSSCYTRHNTVVAASSAAAPAALTGAALPASGVTNTSALGGSPLPSPQ